MDDSKMKQYLNQSQFFALWMESMLQQAFGVKNVAKRYNEKKQ
jgi:hypothetical protein